MLFFREFPEKSSLSTFWFLEIPEPLTATRLKSCGVPVKHAKVNAWLPWPEQTETVSSLLTLRGRRMAKGCQGVVFVGAPDTSGRHYDWSALPGPHVPTEDDFIDCTQQAPTFHDGINHPDTKVIVWAHRDCDEKGACVPLGYHVTGQQFDESHLPGHTVRYWCPLF